MGEQNKLKKEDEIFSDNQESKKNTNEHIIPTAEELVPSINQSNLERSKQKKSFSINNLTGTIKASMSEL